jgi:NADH-quinone oxidoreductase subunit N
VDFAISANPLLNLLAILPEILLALLALLVLAFDVALSPERRRGLGLFAGFGMAAVLAVLIIIARPPAGGVWVLGGMLRFDEMALIFRAVCVGAAALACLISVDVPGIGERGDYYALMIVAAVGLCLMSAAGDLIMVFVGMETASIAFYLLAATRRDGRSIEAAIKLFLFGAFASAFALYGLSLLYGFTGTTHLAEIGGGLQLLSFELLGESPVMRQAPILLPLLLIAVGFLFKLAAVPFHFWAPDTYDGAPLPVAALLSAGSKAAALILLMRVLVWAFPAQQTVWLQLLAVVAALTMSFGSLLTVVQNGMRRLLAYSSIAQAGYALLGVIALNTAGGIGSGSAAFFMIVYMLGNMAAFGVLILAARAAGREDSNVSLDDLAGLHRRAPYLAHALTLALLSLGGIPPLAGFLAKLMLLGAVINAGLAWLATVGAINAVIALYAYLRVLRAVYAVPEEERKPVDVPRPYALALIVACGGLLLIAVVTGPWIRWAFEAAAGFGP